jgi:hypothetical protein
MVLLLMLTAMLTGAPGCRKEDVRTAVIRVPQMRTQAGADLVKKALSQARYGVQPDTIRTDLARRVVALRYDSMLVSLKNIEFMIADAGMDANEVPRNAAAAAKLPADCR